MQEIREKRLEISLTKVFFVVFLFSLFSMHYSLFPQGVIAQAISLSVSPPIFEAIIQPEKEVKQIYTITNNGGDTLVTPKILYFTPSDDQGNVDLTEDTAPDWVKYDKTPFNLKFQEEKQFTVLISPPADAEEIDHFLTLVFESGIPTDVLGQNAAFYKSQIGSNILLTISKDGNPKKSAEIIKFTAPTIVDSLLGHISYDVTLRNNGNSFWKPNGKIILDNNKSIKLAPLNIISGSSRGLSCLNDESLVKCEISDKLSIGKFKASLEFTIDEEAKVYKKEVTTIVFPFIYLGILITILTLLRVRGIFNIWQKRK